MRLDEKPRILQFIKSKNRKKQTKSRKYGDRGKSGKKKKTKKKLEFPIEQINELTAASTEIQRHEALQPQERIGPDVFEFMAPRQIKGLEVPQLLEGTSGDLVEGVPAQ